MKGVVDCVVDDGDVGVYVVGCFAEQKVEHHRVLVYALVVVSEAAQIVECEVCDSWTGDVVEYVVPLWSGAK